MRGKLSLRSPSATPPSDVRQYCPTGCWSSRVSPDSALVGAPPAVHPKAGTECGRPKRSDVRRRGAEGEYFCCSCRNRPITCCRSKTSPVGGLGFRAVTSAFSASTQIQAGGVLNKSAVSVKALCKRPHRKAKSFFYRFFWREQPSLVSSATCGTFYATTMHFQAHSVSVCVCVPVSHCLIVCRGLTGGAG